MYAYLNQPRSALRPEPRTISGIGDDSADSACPACSSGVTPFVIGALLGMIAVLGLQEFTRQGGAAALKGRSQ